MGSGNFTNFMSKHKSIMNHAFTKYLFFLSLFFFTCLHSITAQPKFNLKYKNSTVYAGIEVGSKGVKLTIIEIGKNSRKDGSFNPLKDTSINTDFITFSHPTFDITLNGLTALYNTALTEYEIPSNRIYTTISSGVQGQANKFNRQNMLTELADSFRLRIGDPSRKLAIIDVLEEARLSHIGIVPDDRRYTTFLIDIGSGNTKGGYFPSGNTKDFKLFQLTWGTKSITNAAEKRLEDDKTIANYNRNVYRVVTGDATPEIIYAVNVSNAYNMSDYVAFSGGISWATATLMYPELIDNPVVPVTYDELVKFNDRLLKDYASVSDKLIAKNTANPLDTDAIGLANQVKNVNKVFDQKAMLAGTALLLSIMRQFDGVYEKKQFYLVKNGQVGWISAYVSQSLSQ